MKRWFLIWLAVFSFGIRPVLAEPGVQPLLAAAQAGVGSAGPTAVAAAPAATPAAYETYTAVEGVIHQLTSGDPNWTAYYIGLGMIATSVLGLKSIAQNIAIGAVNWRSAVKLGQLLYEPRKKLKPGEEPKLTGYGMLRQWGEGGEKLAEKLSVTAGEIDASQQALKDHLSHYPSGMPKVGVMRGADWLKALDTVKNPDVQARLQATEKGRIWLANLEKFETAHRENLGQMVAEIQKELNKLESFYKMGNRVALPNQFGGNTNSRWARIRAYSPFRLLDIGAVPSLYEQEPHFVIKPDPNQPLGPLHFENPAGVVQKLESPRDIPHSVAGPVSSSCRSRIALLRSKQADLSRKAKIGFATAGGLVGIGAGGYFLKKGASDRIEELTTLKPEVIIEQQKNQARVQERQELLLTQEPLELVAKLKELRQSPEGAEMAAVYGVLRERVKAHLTDLAIEVQTRHQAAALTGADFWPRFVQAQAKPEVLDAILDKALSAAARGADFNFTEPDRILMALKGQLPGNGETERLFLIAMHRQLPKLLWPLLFPPGSESQKISESVTKKFVEQAKQDLEAWRKQGFQQPKVATAPVVPASAAPSIKP